MNVSPTTTKNESFQRKSQLPGPLMAGVLSKEGSNWKTWKKRYFELHIDGNMSYKKSKEDIEVINTINVKGSIFTETIEKGKPLCIKIIKSNNKPFYICAYNSTDYTNWIDQLILVGAINSDELPKGKQFKKIQRLPRPKTRLETVNVKDWTTDDVCEWMNAICLRFQRPDLVKEYIASVKEAHLSGYQLLQLGSEDLKKLNVKSMGHRAHIRDELDRLENQTAFDGKQMSIYLKFKNLDFSNNRHIKMGNWVESLCDVDSIQQTYLSQNVDNLPVEDLLDKDEIEGLRESMIQQSNVKLRIKLVITEICHTSVDKALRLILSPIISKMPSVSGDFGLFHTALIVGPYYLEWTDSSLCIPKKMVSSMALLTADIDELAVPRENLESTIRKIAEVVVGWNTDFTYRKSSGQTMEYEGNCQDFVDDLLYALGVNPNFNGALANFISNMRDKGKCAIEFTPDKAFKTKFGLKKTTYDFATHSELDEFVDTLILTDSLFKANHPSEFALLKSFDRAFWLRHFKSPEDKKLQPLRKEVRGHYMDLCPFGNPRDTKSMF
jgi:hypothetical protein